MQHPKALAWEASLKTAFDRIDDFLERKYGGQYPLHPARSARGGTSNPEQDGLFNVGAAFSAGYGSRHGPGYIVDVRMATPVSVPAPVRLQIEEEVVELLRKELPLVLPGHRLYVERDGPIFKIFGDLSLGKA
ncbi:MAG TPA: hypothetical protein DCZ95_01825 [Verrucomicrobia bacterium]|nr:hypothetical protein [Verrucomicrobiota bacterium]